MQRSKNDVWVGLFVLLGAAAILFLALKSANLLSLNFQTTYNVTLRLTQSKQFATLWDEANRLAHASVDRALTGSGNITLKTKNGQIVLDLTPIYAEVSKRLEKTSLGITNRLPFSALNKTFVIADVSTLQGAQTATRWFDRIADVLPWLVLAMFVGAVLLFHDRRKGVLRVGIGLLIATLLFAVALALATGVTVLIISVAYSQIIKRFPFGGGGYVVATELLGPRVGVVSGAALLVDYVLTISVSVASGGDAIFSFMPATLIAWKLPLEVIAIAGRVRSCYVGQAVGNLPRCA